MKARIRVLLGLWRHWIAGVVVFSLFLAVFTTVAFDLQTDRDAPMPWDGAEWITSSDNGAVMYFRRSFQLSEKPRKAILKITATDRFEMYVNGVLVEERQQISGTPYWVGAVQDGLKQGTNVIAVRVVARTTNTRPALLVSMQLEDAQTLQQHIVSGNGWKVSRVPEFSVHQNADWFQTSFSDLHWDDVIVTRQIREPRIFRGVSAEHFLETRITAMDSVWHNDLSSDSAAFSLDLDQSRSRFRNAWLAVRCDGNFRISLNKRVLGSFAGHAGQMKIINVFQQLGSARKNNFVVYADCNERRTGVALAFIGEVASGQFVVRPGADWWVTPVSEDGKPRPGSAMTTVKVMKQQADGVAAPITLKEDFYSIEDERVSYRQELAWRGVRWFGIWLTGFTVFMMVLSMPKNCKENALLAHNLVFMLSALGGAGLALLALDARVLAADVFNFFVLSGLVIGCGLMQLAVFFEFRRTVKRGGHLAEGDAA